MPGNVRIGVVGTSWWLDYMFGPALKSHPQADWAAICGRDQNRAQEMAAKFGVPQVYADYREMFARAGLDGVIIATPDDQHHAMTLAALEAGLHVLCEKPLATTAAQAREMVERAEAAGRIHMVLFTYRSVPAFAYARDLVAQGFIGRCYHAEFNYAGGYAREARYAWRFDQDRANGVLGDLGSHMIDMARWILGDITQVSAQLGVNVARPGVDGQPLNPANDSAQLLVHFASGAAGVIQASAVPHFGSRGSHQVINLYGENGSLEAAFDWGQQQVVSLQGIRKGEETFQALEVPAAYYGEASRTDVSDIFLKQPAGARLFVDAIRDQRPVSPNFYDGDKAQQVVDAALESQRSGCAVRIES